MILIADSGSTKTSWIIITGRSVTLEFTTIGLNPYYINIESIPGIIEKSMPPEINAREIKKVIFYGSGCGSVEKSISMKAAMGSLFINSEVEIQTDLLGAARALFGNKPGIAGILGTGANTGFYDGKNIINNLPGYGYILGDEGSGANLGLNLIKLYLFGKLPLEIKQDFQKTFNLSDREILDHIYRNPTPNRFLASFTKFIFSKIDNEIIFNSVRESFEQFFDKYICKYDDYDKFEIRLIGSVATRYSDILNKVAGQRNLKITEILKFPIERLAKFHMAE